MGDNLLRIKKALEEALERADVVIVTGGLGPTEDDLTREAASEVFNKKLVLEKGIFEDIKKRFASHRIPEKAILKQSMIPEGAKIIPNPVGTAPGVIIEEKIKGEGKTAVLLPGVTGELKAMLPFVARYLSRKKGSSRKIIKSRVLRVFGLTESQVNEKIAPLMKSENPTVALLAKQGEIHVRITARFEEEKIEKEIQKMEEKLREKLEDFIYGEDETTLEEVVAKLLLEKKLTLAVAESCTGGLICHRLTNIAGISASLLCGVVSYSNEAKIEILDVEKKLIEKFGAVSSEVALKMAEGVRKNAGSDLSVAVTGIAGPAGGTPEKPVGVGYVALSAKEGSFCTKYQFTGTREMIKWRFSQAALDLLRRYILGKVKLTPQNKVEVKENAK